jgi:organic radical activating enzyme
VYEVLGMLDPVIDPGYYTERGLINLTIGGGEPFEQLDGLSALVRSITRLNSRGDRGRKHILVYSGYTLEELLEGAVGDVRTVKEILKLVNVLVDGRFQDKLVCLKTSSSFIGSDNQRYLVLDKRGKVIAEADASTANSILGDIRKQHLLDLEVE